MPTSVLCNDCGAAFDAPDDADGLAPCRMTGFVAVGAVLPSAGVRVWALRLALAVQLALAVLVGAVIAETRVGLSRLFPMAGRGGFGPPVPIAFGFTFALQTVYTFLQYGLYEAGERAGRTGGD